ncbi:hypothetical protein L345_14221, partial [Ophiophagus hannah]
MEEKIGEAAGVCGACGGALESLPTLLEVQRVEEAVVEIVCQVGTQPKVCSEWPANQEFYWAEENIGSQATFQRLVGEHPITSMWEARKTIFQRRLTVPLGPSIYPAVNPGIGYQTAARHQTLGLLLERFGQLSLGVRQLPQRPGDNYNHHQKPGSRSCGRGCPAKVYVREFQRLTGKLQYWPERLLVHFFKEGLDKELCNTCVCQGISDRIHDWYQMVVAMDIELHWHPRDAREKAQEAAQLVSHQWEELSRRTSMTSIKCFRCGQ